ncbi:MAG: TVP38/TMEM64 family protein [Phycisphaerales bacterium]|nr:TVP38/TMEM64 family protein [Phycisphaerales bacterium]
MSGPSLQIDIDTLPDHHRSWWGVAIKSIAALALVGVLFLLFHYFLEPYMPALEEFMQKLGGWGPLLYIAVFLIATSIFIPESIIAIAAGAIFGLWMGLLWVVVAATITAVCIFVLGRHFLRARVEVMLGGHPKIKAIDRAASAAGFRLMVLLRLSPLNYTLLSYVLAVSRARFKPYLLACLGMIPGNFSTVYIGFAAKHAADLAKGMEDCGGKLPSDTTLTHELTVFIGLGAAILASVVVARIAMREIRKATKEASEVPS